MPAPLYVLLYLICCVCTALVIWWMVSIQQNPSNSPSHCPSSQHSHCQYIYNVYLHGECIYCTYTYDWCAYILYYWNHVSLSPLSLSVCVCVYLQKEFEIVCVICTNVAVNQEDMKPVSLAPSLSLPLRFIMKFEQYIHLCKVSWQHYIWNASPTYISHLTLLCVFHSLFPPPSHYPLSLSLSLSFFPPPSLFPSLPLIISSSFPPLSHTLLHSLFFVRCLKVQRCHY